MAKHWFWLFLTTACVVWYCVVTLRVSVKGVVDIRSMLARLSKNAQEQEEGS